ncbi:MAG: peptidylprolyl isomerase [Planctomycetes bacterium]|nr:peptidylprolyl isomerase [Planctomycetota bacterium]
MRLSPFSLVSLATLVLLTSRLPAQQAKERVVAATVDGAAVYADEVHEQLSRGLKGRQVEPAARAALQAHALRQLIDRQLIYGYLKQKKTAAGPARLKAEIDEIELRLAMQKQTLAGFLKETGQTREAFEKELIWKLSWEAYLKRNVTDRNLQAYFNANRAQFDGTQVRISQILLRVKDTKNQTAVDTALKNAAAIRKEIVAGTLSFSDAAAKHSAGSTAKTGGDLGFIERRGAMGETISKAAFALNKGQVSPPLVTQFGVHLVQCTAIKPGQKQWTDARRQLQRQLPRYLFRWLADRNRQGATIRYTGRVPHFKPGTTQLAR